MKELTHAVGAALQDRLDGFVYKKARTELVKTSEGLTYSILVDMLPARQADMMRVSLSARVRIEALAEVYLPFYPMRDEKARKTKPTVIWNCLNLFRDPSPLTGVVAKSMDEVDAIANLCLPGLRDDVIPHLERYGSIENLLASFEQPDPLDWVSSDREVRYNVLLSAYVLAGNRQRFESAATEYLAFCQKPQGVRSKKRAEAVIDGLKDHPNLAG